MFNIKTLLITALISAAISALAAVHYTSEYKDGVYAQKMIENERISNAILQFELERRTQIERGLVEERDRLEVENAKSKKRIDGLLNDYNAAISRGDRLRDPGARASSENSCPTASPSAPIVDGRIAGAELSEEASRFLLSEAARADAITEQLNLCKAWLLEVKRTLDTYQDNP